MNIFKNSLDKHWAENPQNVRVNCDMVAIIDVVHNPRVHNARVHNARVHNAKVHNAKVHNARVRNARVHKQSLAVVV